MKIYTRTGDDGTTGLFGGGRVRKDAVRVAAYGAVDELNASIGLARAVRRAEGDGADAKTSHGGRPPSADADLDALLARVQSDLFELGADLATPPASKAERHVRRIGPQDAHYLEEAIDRLEKELEPLEQFILPGGVPFAAQLHLTRGICRRAERDVVALSAVEPVGSGVLIFLNRLSDLLFVMGRAANRRCGLAETRWAPRKD